MRSVWWWAAIAAFVSSGCSNSSERAHCATDEVVPCVCTGGAMGTQICSASGAYGACACTGPATCVVDQLFACTCAGGALGAQRCLPSGQFGACSCDSPTPAPTCVTGASVACACTAGDLGAQVCNARGAFDPCVCEPATTTCVPGRSVGCACPDGSTSAQLCAPDGTFAACACGAADAGMGDDASRLPDAGPLDDTGVPHICDPWHGETCGCPETTAPTTPTLPRPTLGVAATGATTLVDVFVTSRGVIVVHTGGATLVSRAGATLATWTASRQVLSATFDGAHLVIADAGAATTLTPDLTMVSSALVTEACASGVLDSCGHYVCGPANDWDRIFYTYDVATGAALGRSDPYTYDGIPMHRIPGANAFITCDTELSPSHMYFFRIGTDGTAAYGTDWPYHGDFIVNGTFAFVGSPASHVVNVDGRLLRLDPCMNQPDTFGTGDCLSQDGSLGTLHTGELFLAMEGTASGDLYALAGTSGTFSGDPVCTSGCRVQHIDVATRTVSSETALGFAPASVPVLRYDAWSNVVVLASATTCNRSTFPVVCSGWTLRYAAF